MIDATNGKVVNADDLTDHDFVIIDGQHRTEAHLRLQKEATESGEPLGFDLPVTLIKIPSHIDDGMYIYTVNTTPTNWNFKDRTQFINAVVRDPNTGLYHALQLMNSYGIGIRYATALFQLRDGFRTKMQTQFVESGKLDDFLKSSPEKIERGLKLFESLKVGFQSKPKQIKNMAALEVAIETYQNANDDEKEKVFESLCLFFKSLTLDEINDIATLTSKDSKKDKILEIWDDFKDRNADEDYLSEVHRQATENEEAMRINNPYSNIARKSNNNC